MTDDSPYQDAKDAKAHLNGFLKSVDNFFTHSTSRVLGPAATKLRTWWSESEEKKRIERLRAANPRSSQAPRTASKAWWPPFGWGKPKDAPETAPAPADNDILPDLPGDVSEGFETMDPPGPGEMVDL